jgi:hypothetical protein
MLRTAFLRLLDVLPGPTEVPAIASALRRLPDEGTSPRRDPGCSLAAAIRAICPPPTAPGVPLAHDSRGTSVHPGRACDLSASPCPSSKPRVLLSLARTTRRSSFKATVGQLLLICKRVASRRAIASGVSRQCLSQVDLDRPGTCAS